MSFAHLLNQTVKESDLLDEVCAIALKNYDKYMTTHVFMVLEKQQDQSSKIIDVMENANYEVIFKHRIDHWLGDAFVLVTKNQDLIYIKIYGHYIELSGRLSGSHFKKIRQNYKVKTKKRMTEWGKCHRAEKGYLNF
jgi:hypothetical protein